MATLSSPIDTRSIVLCLTIALAGNCGRHSLPAQEAAAAKPAKPAHIQADFQAEIKPLVKSFCWRCHNPDDMKSGIRVDQLTDQLSGKQLFLADKILEQLEDQAMPPDDEPQPNDEERETFVRWLQNSIANAKSRRAEKNGIIRRLTISQYQNTLRDLLGLQEDVCASLPPDGISKDGFVNNAAGMSLSPLLIEAYFNIAAQALDRCIVDVDSRPSIQNFRMDLGKAINQQPCPDKLILGAQNRLLANADFIVRQVVPGKPFPFDPITMRTKFRFNEGYQGNATVRGWRDYDSIYHAVFACMRGTPGYPKGQAHETVPGGLLLRPAIPSSELFGKSSTYGPMANFKISLRQLPDHGNFRITVRAARYDDGLLLDGDTPLQPLGPKSIVIDQPSQPQTVNVPSAGIYQVDVRPSLPKPSPKFDATQLNEGLIAAWSFDDDTVGRSGEAELTGETEGEAQLGDSPFGKALRVNGQAGALVVPRGDNIQIGTGEFTVAAWIYPRHLRQSGIVCLGGYGYTHGWLLDMPDGRGTLRLETARSDNQSNGTVKSRRGVISVNRWQHVAVTSNRQENGTRLFVNGHHVGRGTIGDADLDNPNVSLNIGRIQGAQVFHGAIDDVRLYHRALRPQEIHALVQPGRAFATPPGGPDSRDLKLALGNRHFSGKLSQGAFMAVRLPPGKLDVSAAGDGLSGQQIVMNRLEASDPVAIEFTRFEKLAPQLGVHLGLRRDCGSTLNAVGSPQPVASATPQDFVFSGAINNFPAPHVEKNNVNYLAGIREIGVRSEYTDGRDMPRLLIQSVEFEGPFLESWPPQSHQNIFLKQRSSESLAQYGRRIIRDFARRAFRRPITAGEQRQLMQVFDESIERQGNFVEAIKDTLLVILTSPQFLFLIEQSHSPAPEPLDPHELASKLSYFLWNTSPDSRLHRVAADGQLHRTIDIETNRMIADPRFAQFIDEFTTQWLSLDKFDVVQVDREKYPDLTRDTKTQLRRESAALLKHLIRNNLPLANLIDSEFVLVNEVTAQYYGLADKCASGFRFVPVRHDTDHLGGLLSNASILSGLSDGRHSNPVKRGAWVARKIVAMPPDDPPPNVPDLEDDPTDQLSLRERLERHRDQEGCAKCHSGIDPWGLALEEFDAGGRKKSGSVDARSTLPDNTEINGLNDLKRYLVGEQIDRVAFSVLKHLAVYATGRELSYNEIQSLKQEQILLKERQYRMKDMILFIVGSKLFLEK